MDSGERASPEDLAYALRILADTLKAQSVPQEKVVDKWTSGESRAKVLSTIRIPQFEGHPNTTVKRYRDWKKDIEAVKLVNNTLFAAQIGLAHDGVKSTTFHSTNMLRVNTNCTPTAVWITDVG